MRAGCSTSSGSGSRPRDLRGVGSRSEPAGSRESPGVLSLPSGCVVRGHTTLHLGRWAPTDRTTQGSCQTGIPYRHRRRVSKVPVGRHAQVSGAHHGHRSERSEDMFALRSRTSSRNTSPSAGSNSAPAPAPTARPANTSTPASAARPLRRPRRSSAGWKRSPPASPSASPRQKNAAGRARSTNSRSPSRPPQQDLGHSPPRRNRAARTPRTAQPAASAPQALPRAPRRVPSTSQA